MSAVLMPNIPYWVITLVITYSWVNLAVDIIKFRNISYPLEQHYSSLIWSMKAGTLLLVGKTQSLPNDPWVLLLLLWAALDMWLNSFLAGVDARAEEESG